MFEERAAVDVGGFNAFLGKSTETYRKHYHKLLWFFGVVCVQRSLERIDAVTLTPDPQGCGMLSAKMPFFIVESYVSTAN